MRTIIIHTIGCNSNNYVTASRKPRCIPNSSSGIHNRLRYRQWKTNQLETIRNLTYSPRLLSDKYIHPNSSLLLIFHGSCTHYSYNLLGFASMTYSIIVQCTNSWFLSYDLFTFCRVDRHLSLLAPHWSQMSFRLLS